MERGIPILHVIDTCLRWSAAMVLPDKSEQTLLNALSTIWVRVLGAPGVFTQDEERGLKEHMWLRGRPTTTYR